MFPLLFITSMLIEQKQTISMPGGVSQGGEYVTFYRTFNDNLHDPESVIEDTRPPGL